MESRIFAFDEAFNGQNGPAFSEFLRLRKKTFIDGLGWSLPFRDDLESDQYDNPHAHYLLVTDQGRVVAGSRVMPADRDWYGWTHFLKDAALGKIPEMAANLLPANFDFRGTYECSRLVVDHDRLTASQVAEAFEILGGAFAQLAQSEKIGTYLSLSPLALLRKFRGLGFDVDAVGEVYRCPDDSRRYRTLRLHNVSGSSQLAA